MLILAAAYLSARAADTVCTAWGDPEPVVVPGGNPEPQASGLVRGIDADTFLTMGDAGTDTDLTVLGLDGAVVDSLRPGGVTNTDWEDLARGPCPGSVGADECLYIADIGDNLESRPSLAAWVLPIDDLEGTAVACALAYDDGVPRDAEAFFVTTDGTLRVVTKEPDAKVYRLASPRCDGTVELMQREAELALSEDPTGAALSPDGSQLVLRGHTTAWLWPAACTIDWSAEPATPPIREDERKGEAIAFTDAGDLVTVSEQPTLAEGEEPAAMQLSINPCTATEDAPACPECGCAGGGAGTSVAGVLAAVAIGRSRARRSRSRSDPR